jgi:hypothetical protein
MSAAEIADLANMALAEVGAPETCFADPAPGLPLRISASFDTDPTAFFKAVKLARLKILGPSAPTTCRAHSGRIGVCELVTVADALMGRTCGAS